MKYWMHGRRKRRNLEGGRWRKRLAVTGRIFSGTGIESFIPKRSGDWCTRHRIFLAPEGDHYRTRLTHTLEVAQVSRTIARILNYNEDLTEAIALGHDLGHTPFGHNGEAILDRVYPGGFKHREQSLRVVDRLESSAKRRGLNLTTEVRDGILNHSGPNLPFTMEGQIVRFSDRIAYINHDIDDAIRSGVISEKDLPEKNIRVLGRTHSNRINNLIDNLVHASADQDRIQLSPSFQEALDELREFMFRNVYDSARVKMSGGHEQGGDGDSSAV